MGRELRRKQAKKEGKSLEKENLYNENQIKKLLKITLLLVFVGAIIYLCSALFVTKELDWFDKNDDKEDTTKNVENSILASASFKQSEEEYYVYFYDFNDENTEITSLINSKLTTAKIYKVNTGSAMNANYVSEIGNKKAKTLEDLKVKAPTIIKISADLITEYYEDADITNKLK